MFWRKKPEPTPTIYAEETCGSCGERVRRRFEEGDHIYKQGGACKKCSSATLITAVYGEYPPEKH